MWFYAFWVFNDLYCLVIVNDPILKVTKNIGITITWSQNVFNFKIINITDNTSFFDLEVEVHEGFYFGVLLAKNVYSIKFDVKETPSYKLDKGSYTGNAQDLKTDIETRKKKSEM